MRRFSKSLFWFFCLATILGSFQASALDFGIRGSLILGFTDYPDVSAPNGDATKSNSLSYGLGVSLGFPISNSINLELMPQFVIRNTSIEGTGSLVSASGTISTNSVRAPLVVLYSLSPSFAVGGGGYGAVEFWDSPEIDWGFVARLDAHWNSLSPKLLIGAQFLRSMTFSEQTSAMEGSLIFGWNF